MELYNCKNNIAVLTTEFGHLSCSSYGHGMQLLIMCYCGTHNSHLQASHGMTNLLLLQQCRFHGDELLKQGYDNYTING